MNILILGGTIFLGRHIVESALARGHKITLFNRGQHGTDLFPPETHPTVEKLTGDRDGNLDTLRNRQWDAVIDPSGYIPRLVTDSAQLLADAVEQYIFISSISVYSDMSPGIDENFAVGKLEDETVEDVTGETYGPLKALCEQAAEAAMPGRVCNVRAGLIVGPHDPTDRFTYWPHRIARGGSILAPDSPNVPTQFIHARDLADWIIHMAETKQVGTYNATGPADPLTMGEFFDVCKRVTENDPDLTWASEEFLLENEVGPFVEMPIWVPTAVTGMNQADCAKAITTGLTFRPLTDTIRDTWSWSQTRPDNMPWRAGLAPEREIKLLEKWAGQ